MAALLWTGYDVCARLSGGNLILRLFVAWLGWV